MLNRDKEIIEALEKFKVLSRDQIINLFFQGVNQPIVIANRIMRRLRKKGYVTLDYSARPYNYFINPAPINMKSSKILHYQAVADFYIELCNYERPILFETEYKVAPTKGFVEPDGLFIVGGIPFYLEMQKTPITNTLMLGKYDKYVEYFNSNLWQKEFWQPKTKEPIFPQIILISDKLYNFPEKPIQILQTDNAKNFYYQYIR